MEGRDGSIFVLSQEGGVTLETLNQVATDCAEYVTPDEGGEEVLLPWVFREKFKTEMMSKVYASAIPACSSAKSTDDQQEMDALGLSILPGLVTLRTTLRQRLAETNNDSLSSVN